MSALYRDLDNFEQVDISQLDKLLTAPAKPSFFKTQSGRALLTMAVMVGIIVFLTILLRGLKP